MEQKQSEVVLYRANEPVGDARTLEGLLQRDVIMQSFRGVIAKHLNPERLAKMALMAASRQPTLYKCTKGSLLQSVLKAAELGLSCSGSMARGYLVPFYNTDLQAYEAQFITGYGGLIDILCNGGSVRNVDAKVVYKDDLFEFEEGAHPDLHHKRTAGKRTDDDIVWAYAVAFFREGGFQFLVMDREELEDAKQRTKSKTREGKIVGPWATDFAAMCKKTPVRKIANYLPLTEKQQEKLALADENDEEYASQLTPPTVELRPTEGREKWGFPGQQEEPPSPEEPTEPGQQSEPQPGLNDPPTDLFGKGEDMGWMAVEALFSERCELRGYDEKHVASAQEALFAVMKIKKWEDLKDEAHCTPARAWIHRHLSVPKEKKE